MSLLDTITRFSTAAPDGSPGGYTITRYAGGTYGSDGIAIASTPSTFTIDAAEMPFVGKLEVLPEGVRSEDVRVIVTATALQSIPLPDHITIAGEDFVVFNLDGPFSMSGIQVYRAYAARQVIP